MNVDNPLDSRTPTKPGLNPIEAAILHTVAYVDVFDYPLTAAEVHRYLVGVPAAAAKVNAVLANGRLVPDRLSARAGYFTLPGREEIIEARRQRATVAERLWPWALHYGRLFTTLPFVRMVAVTGSLAVDNVDPNADIDYLIVTENGHLWLCRALVIVIVRLAARRGITLCPNYFLTERALLFQERNLYNARELAQMIPLAGLDTYCHLRRLNTWTTDYLPNAHGVPPATDRLLVAPSWSNRPRRLAESFLRTAVGVRLEQWEMARKIRKFSRQTSSWRNQDAGSEAAFSADWCKGHFDNHGQRIMERFSQRLESLFEERE